MTDQTPTSAQAAAQEALFRVITDGVEAVRDSGHQLDNNTAAIKMLAEAYSLVVDGK
ncbi:hypothetical protein [Clavibacter michiganensis]|uniref:Uncharacterized protein n=1 Tax=Clavibacter michiganensis TaxID=28447 RepID=A0A251YMM6_9MICO|nr:hypothetical protein [Clavibacter michiganensis]OUE25516.1 hypothetical protein BFL37_05895 [Clavibacter michiganensis]